MRFLRSHICALAISVVSILLGVVCLYFFEWLAASKCLFDEGFFLKRKSEQAIELGEVRGSLGGVFVAIPAYFAEQLEYDGDMNCGGDRKMASGQGRAIKSFGFDVLFPSMEGKSSSELLNDYKNRKLRTNQWLDVGLSAGSNYVGAGGVERMAGAYLKEKESWLGDYVKLKDKSYGLDVYALHGVDEKSGKPYRENLYAKDIFVYKNAFGKITTYIACSNRAVLAPPCSQYFDLEPEMAAMVRVVYRRELLSEWRLIQEEVGKMVLGFREKGN